MKKNKFSKNWIIKQKRDIYVKKSKLEGYRSRAVYKLQEINEELWDIENIKRDCEANKDFGSAFIKISRDVHFKNDVRASIKREINLLTDSKITEEKEYSKY